MRSTSVDNVASSTDDLEGVQKSLMIHDVGILNSLSFPSMLDKRDKTKQLQQNACQWLLSTQEYERWQTKSNSILWITGKPGAGKSALMSFLSNSQCSDEVRTNRGSPEVTKLRLTFFFKEDGIELQRNTLGMIRSLLYQLYRQDTEVHPLVIEKYKEKLRLFGQPGSNGWQWNCEELKILLVEAISVSLRCYDLEILIDAVDESDAECAEDVEQYLRLLCESATNFPTTTGAPNLRICISGCRQQTGFKSSENIIVMEEHNGNDLAFLIQESVKSLQKSSQYSSVECRRHELKEQINSRAQQNFQWVRLTTSVVQRCIWNAVSTNRIQQFIRDLPPQLDEAYEYAIRNTIHTDHQAQIYLLFQWLCFAVRPLSLAEVQHALLASGRDRCSSNPDGLEDHEAKDLDTQTGELLQMLDDFIDVEPELPPHQATVRLAHPSVYRFLTRKGLRLLDALQTGQNIPVNHRSFDRDVTKRGHSILYWRCLNYLATEDFELVRGYCKSRSYSELATRLPFLKYAVTNILLHAEEASDHRPRNTRSEKQLWQRILPDWCFVYRELYASSRACPNRGTSVLHVTAITNMIDIMEDLLKEEVDVNVKDDCGCTALHFAAQKGNQIAIKLLLNFGADVDAQITTSGTTAIQEAASQGNAEIVQMLLDLGADANIQGKTYSTALSTAVRNNHVEIVLILLRAGADINASEEVYGTALQTASICGRREVVLMLLTFGAAINSQGGRSGTALQAAALGPGGEDICQLLLSAGAQVNMQAGMHGSALQAASLRGKNEMVKMLLAAGADVNARGGRCGTALHAAIRKNRIEVVQTLIDHGADVNARGAIHDTPLRAAELWAGREIIQILLNAGALRVLPIETSEQRREPLLIPQPKGRSRPSTRSPSYDARKLKITTKLKGLIQKISKPKRDLPEPPSSG